MANNITEQLFDAITLIASKQVADLPYDKTVVCHIIDNTYAAEGKYTVSDGTSEFLAYSEKTDYRVNNKVYVTIPGNDMLNKRYIAGMYIEDSSASYANYISPMDNFIDCTGDIAQLALSQQDQEFSLLANGETKFLTLWDSGEVSLKNYTCLGIQGEFRSLFNGNIPTKGNYGLGIYLTYHRLHIVEDASGKMQEEIQTDVTLHKMYYLDSSDMFGDPYNFTIKYLQEKIFDITGMAEIVNVQIVFYQSQNFQMANDEYFDPTGLEDNLFVSDIQIKFGELLSNYTEDAVKLICNDDLRYRKENLELKTAYLRWIHLVDDGAIVIDENDDIDLLDQLAYVTNDGQILPNWKVRWYRQVLKQDVRDPIAGNFWEEQPEMDDIWSRIIEPDPDVQYDKWKVIIEFPRADLIEQAMVDQVDSGYTDLLELALMALDEAHYTNTNFLELVEAYITNTPTEMVADEPVVVDFYDRFCNNMEEYPELFGNTAIGNLKSYIIAQKSEIAYYESNVISFQNENNVNAEAVDLVQGLKILVDDQNGGYNGHYNLYDENNIIMNNHEAKKERIMRAQYNSIAINDDSLLQADEILWCIPIENSMIQVPQDGIEYDLENGDFYFTVDKIEDINLHNEKVQKILNTYDSVKIEELQAQLETSQKEMLRQIAAISIDDYSTHEEYTAAVAAIKGTQTNNMKDLGAAMGYVAENNYAQEFENMAGSKYAVILRKGAELADVAEQLIEVEQKFRIKDYYQESATNNTVYCLVRKYGKIYTAEATMRFGTAGTSGTEMTLSVRMVDEDNHEVSALSWNNVNGDSIIVKAELYDFNNQLVEFSNPVSYKWYNKPNIPDSIELTPIGNYAILKLVHGDWNMLGAAHAILQVETDYTIESADLRYRDNGVQERTVTLTAYLPIPIRYSNDVSHMTGATRVIYDTNGVNPSYYKGKYEIFSSFTHDSIESTWTLEGEELSDPTSRRYYPTLSENNELLPTPMYYSNMQTISVCGWSDLEDPADESGQLGLLWLQPILIMQNKYGSAMLNNWDGSLEIDETNGTIMSAMVGAGIKNEDNTFSGVLMGNVALADESIGNKTGLGVYGFHHGDQSFGLNVDGTAFLGKAGSGRIVFDGNKGIIQSYNYTEPTRVVGNENQVAESGMGMSIDLDDSKIDAYGKTGSVQINTDQYNQPLFVIRDANYDTQNPKGHTLFYVSSSAYDPTSRRSYDAQYYLQSSNYNAKDPSEEGTVQNQNNDNCSTGALFNLEKGRLDIHGKAGRVSIHGDGKSDLFQIKGWVQGENGWQKNVLMNVASQNYYLQSLNYKANEKGFKLDINNGRILAADLSIKAGNASTGMIQINTNGSPYLSITSGKDYVQEGNQYITYDAVDVANVEARFQPNTYYVVNQRQSGYYGIEEYHGEYVNSALLADNSMKYYYCHDHFIEVNFNNNYEVLRDAGVLYLHEILNDENDYRLVEPNEVYDVNQTYYQYSLNEHYHAIKGIMHPEDTRSFVLSRLPDAERLYYIQDRPLAIDNTPQYRDDVLYFANYDDNEPIENMRNPATTYHFSEMRDAGKLYKQSKIPVSANGTEYVEGRQYYFKIAENSYQKVQYIEADNKNCVIWEANKFYIRTNIYNAYILSQVGWAPNQTYYVALDPEHLSSHILVLNENGQSVSYNNKWVGDELFKPTVQKVVHPNTYFYNSGLQELYYYSDEWIEVGKNETMNENNYRYGLKLFDHVSILYDVVDDNVPIYVPGKYYVYDEDQFEYAEATEYVDGIQYYYKLWDDYEECNVISYECDEYGFIFKPNKYWEHVSESPYIIATEYDSAETYYKYESDIYSVITLCDLDFTPYLDAKRKNDRKLGYFNGTIWTPTNENVNDSSDYVAGQQYYYKYTYLDVPSNNNGPSLKLVNITKNKFELCSHNWDATNFTGMYFNITSNSSVSDLVNPLQENGGLEVEDQTQGAEGTTSDLATQLSEISSNNKVNTGGGYIIGYGHYLDTSGRTHQPSFILDWRAGHRYPIAVNTNKFRVEWNGRVEIADLHAYSGRIGSWYMTNDGIFSYNPYSGGNKVGVALLHHGTDTLPDGSDICEVPKSSIIVNNHDLRIAVGHFSGSTTTTTYTNYRPFKIEEGAVLSVPGSYIQLVYNENGEAIYQVVDEASGEISYQTTDYNYLYTLYAEDTVIEEPIDVTETSIAFTDVDSTGFAVYRNGLMRAYGAIIRGARIQYGYIDSATIDNAKIHKATITKATIKDSKIQSATVGTLSGGSISGATIKGGKISGATITGGSITGSTITGGTITGSTVIISGQTLRFTVLKCVTAYTQVEIPIMTVTPSSSTVSISFSTGASTTGNCSNGTTVSYLSGASLSGSAESGYSLSTQSGSKEVAARNHTHSIPALSGNGTSTTQFLTGVTASAGNTIYVNSCNGFGSYHVIGYGG